MLPRTSVRLCRKAGQKRHDQPRPVTIRATLASRRRIVTAMIPQAKTYVSLSAVYSRNSAPAITARLAARPLQSFGIMLATIVLTFTLHVLWCMRSPARLMAERREMGFFLLQGVWPTFYADVTDIFMSSRRDRVMVDSPRDPSSRSWAVAWPSSACMAHNRESPIIAVRRGSCFGKARY